MYAGQVPCAACSSGSRYALARSLFDRGTDTFGKHPREAVENENIDGSEQQRAVRRDACANARILSALVTGQ